MSDGRAKEMAKEKSRRDYGDGAIYQRESDGRYVASLRLSSGRRKYFYSSKSQTDERKARAEVKAKLEKFKRELEAGIAATEATRQTVSAYLDYWLEVKKATVRASTIISHRKHLKPLRPLIGHIKLTKLTTDQVQVCYGKLQKTHAPNTIRTVHRILSAAMNDAVEWKRIGVNPCKSVKQPREEEVDYQILTHEQAKALMEAAKGTVLEAMIAVAVTTGMRRGELFGLKWSDVDLEQGRLHVKHTASYLCEEGHTLGFVENEPKTQSGKRQIVLPAFVVTALKSHRTRQIQARWQGSEKWKEQGLVFANRFGGHFSESTLYKQFARLLQHAGLPHMRIHDLRHSAATILLSQGVNIKVVQELLGHSSIEITLTVYSHVLPTMQQTAMETIDRLYSNG